MVDMCLQPNQLIPRAVHDIRLFVIEDLGGESCEKKQQWQRAPSKRAGTD
jgi:hypothetical protein